MSDLMEEMLVPYQAKSPSGTTPSPTDGSSTLSSEGWCDVIQSYSFTSFFAPVTLTLTCQSVNVKVVVLRTKDIKLPATHLTLKSCNYYTVTR